MNKTIRSHTLSLVGETKLTLPLGTQFLGARGNERDDLVLDTLEPDLSTSEHTITVYSLGMSMSDEAEYVGAAEVAGVVYHVFGRVTSPPPE